MSHEIVKLLNVTLPPRERNRPECGAETQRVTKKWSQSPGHNIPNPVLTTLDFLITQNNQSSLTLKTVYVELCAICIKNKNIKCYVGVKLKCGC